MPSLASHLRPALTLALALAFAAPEGAHAAASTTRAWPAGRPPWGRGDAPLTGTVGLLPVRVEPGPEGTPDSWVPKEALDRLAAALTTSFAAQAADWVALDPLPPKDAPLARVGCALEMSGSGDCDAAARAMELSVRGPSKAWRAAALQAMTAAGLDHLVVPTVTITNHWLRQANWKGTKEIELGSGHAQRVPWLTSLDTPVEVVQVSVVVIGRDGKVARSAVEGLVAVRTGFPASVGGFQKVVSPDDIDAVTAGARREDLPGSPSVVDAAVKALLDGVLRR